MKSPIVISISPNIGSSDIKLAFKTLFTLRLWKKEDINTSAKKELQSIFPGHQVELISSGRTALYYLLKGVGIGQGDEVVIQAFTCLAVPASLQWAGTKPVYADINATTYNLDPASLKKVITPRTKAVIVQHTFGVPANLEEIKSICDQAGIILIEDCAHALGGTYNNQPLGTFGQAAILSFGRDKIISSVFGGAIISKDKNLMQKISSQQQQLSYPPAAWTAQQLLHPILTSLALPVYFTAKLGPALMVLFQSAGLLSKAVSASEKIGRQPSFLKWRFSPALGSLLRHQLNQLPQNLAHRRHVASQYISALKTKFHPLPPIASQTHPAWLRFPLQVSDPIRVRNIARQQHMLLGDWYDSAIAPANVDPDLFNYAPGSCPVAEQVASRIINLPTHPRLGREDAQRVIDFICSQP